MASFDVLIASYNRANILEKCLNSIAAQKHENLQKVLILTLENDAETKNIVTQISEKLPIKLLTIKNILKPGASRNRLLDGAKSEWICFLDDDSMVSDNYFRHCLEHIDTYNPDIFGGPDKSISSEGLKQTVIGEVLASPFVMGPTYKRHDSNQELNIEADETILTLCNMWMKKSIFETNKLKFDEDLKRCEENQLLEEIKSLGLSINYNPKLFIFHHRREDISKIIRIQFLSGFYRSVCFYQTKETFKWFFSIPLLTGLLILLLPLFSPLLLLYLSFAHFLLSLVVLSKIWKKFNSLYAILWAWLVIVTIHTFFSLGMVFGIVLGWKKVEK